MATRGKNILDEIYKKAANDIGCTIDEVESIASFQFTFLRDIMEKSEFETVRFPYLGKFTVNLNRLKIFNTINKSTNYKDVIQRGKFQGSSKSRTKEDIRIPENSPKR